MNKLFTSFLFSIMLGSLFSQNTTVAMSQELLKSARMNLQSEQTLEQLKQLSFNDLQKSLDSDAEKLAFWINVYNAVTQLTLKAHPEYFEDRGSFYPKKLITIAGEAFSLDEIEHGILRRNTSKYSLGYFRKLSTRKAIKKLMVRHIDPRIHYALNCGAKSCPPVAFFDDQKLDQQLDLSCAAYLEAECIKADGKIQVPALFSWFRGDFGGKKGIYKFLRTYKIIEKNEKPDLVFKDYNWDLMLGNYKDL